jgi:hypothetical protein
MAMVRDGTFPHWRPGSEPLLPQTNLKNVLNSKSFFFKTIPHFKKNQFYNLIAIGFGGQGLVAKFHGGQDMFVKTLITNKSSDNCHLPWRPDPHLAAIGYGGQGTWLPGKLDAIAHGD